MALLFVVTASELVDKYQRSIQTWVIVLIFMAEEFDGMFL
jgi:hypothetical protein